MDERSRLAICFVTIASAFALLGWSKLPVAETNNPVVTDQPRHVPLGKTQIAERQSVVPTPDSPVRESFASLDVPAAQPLTQVELLQQSVRRGGLGSKALGTFVIRNRNDYPVNQLAVVCAFSRADGRITSRRRTLPETVKAKSNARISRTLIGFVNVNASRANCTLASAGRA